MIKRHFYFLLDTEINDPNKVGKTRWVEMTGVVHHKSWLLDVLSPWQAAVDNVAQQLMATHGIQGSDIKQMIMRTFQRIK